MQSKLYPINKFTTCIPGNVVQRCVEIVLSDSLKLVDGKYWRSEF